LEKDYSFKNILKLININKMPAFERVDLLVVRVYLFFINYEKK